MAVPDVDNKLLMELQAMGFPLPRASHALHFSGNSSIEDAVSWIIDHENDPDMDEMPLIPMDIDVKSPESFDITEEVKMKAEVLRNGHKPGEEQGNGGHESRGEREEELRHRTRKSLQEREKELEREREKERRRSSKQLVEAKQVAEENARKRAIALREAEKTEDRRARERIRHTLEADKAERRSTNGSLPDTSGSAPSIQQVQQQSFHTSATNLSANKAEHLIQSLRTLKRSCKGDDAKAKMAFETLHVYVRNVMIYPDQHKYRRIRLTNPVFQDRIGSLRGGIRFLELCGFERLIDSQFLYLPRDKIHMAVLNPAMRSLQSALTNPFFGLLSTETSSND